MFKKLVIVVAALAAMSTSANANNIGGATRTLKPRAMQTLAAPVGYQIFCMKNKSDCRGGGASSIALTSTTASLLRQVNNTINASIRYRSDRSEVWSVGGMSGDCEDFALTKRNRLIRAGLPAGALRMATARTARGELHAVLIVKTDKGDLVLDNIRKTIVPRERSGYRYLKVATSDPRVWQPARRGQEI